MVPLAMSHFLAGHANVVDVYVQLGKNRFVLLYKRGDSPEKSRLEHYQRNAGQLWITKNELPLLINKNIRMAEIAFKAKGISRTDKTKLFLNMADTVFKEISFIEFNEICFQRAKKIITMTLEIVQNSEDLDNVLEQLRSFDSSLFKRSIMITGVATLIGAALNWNNKANMESLALAALLQDVGLMELPQELILKPFVEMTEQERELYDLHPLMSEEILSKIPDINTDVLKIVSQHHELPSGKGFPRGTKKLNIHPLAELVILAGIFSDLILFEKNGQSIMSKKIAVDYIKKSFHEPFNLKTLRALQRVIS